MRDGAVRSLAEGVLAGDRRAVARTISLIEEGNSTIQAVLGELNQHAGRAHLVGITGPPGAGKSSLVRGIVLEYRSRDRRVGVIAVDPSSPFTGGALLGDRVRMQNLSLDSDVFVRSMATRGAHGGLARAVGSTALVLDAWGADVVIIETVGAGQGEVEVARVAHTVVVIEVPQLGDDIQAIKAGILEIADVLVVNKAEKDGADQMVAALQAMLEMGAPREWMPPVVKTIATAGDGVAELTDELIRHLDYLRSSGRLVDRTAEWARRELMSVLQDELLARFCDTVGRESFDQMVQAVARRDLDVFAAARKLLPDCH